MSNRISPLKVKSEMFPMRLSKIEKALLRIGAKKDNMPAAEVLRCAFTEYIKKKKYRNEISEFGLRNKELLNGNQNGGELK